MKGDETKARINRILNAEKEEMNEATRAAALADFTHIAREYFETEGDVDFRIRKEKSALEVTVTFRAFRVKNFTILK